ncbi:MAG: hypothetical protein IT379_14810 [Deltaproteobacteria bacterium]|nr:hypothetical protein [Deltaproteobacteria bacterium]
MRGAARLWCVTGLALFAGCGDGDGDTDAEEPAMCRFGCVAGYDCVDGECECNAERAAAGGEPEECNGRDDDCDGVSDEDSCVVGRCRCSVGIGGNPPMVDRVTCYCHYEDSP